MAYAAARHLSAFIGAPVEDIRRVSSEAVTWPDTSLGCPAAGVEYAQVPVEGAIITLRGDGQTYTYHTDNDRGFILCQDGEPLESGTLPRN
jgi:hypothetical protein